MKIRITPDHSKAVEDDCRLRVFMNDSGNYEVSFGDITIVLVEMQAAMLRDMLFKHRM